MATKLWLSGDAPDLAYLAAALPVGDVRVIKDGDRFCLISEEDDRVAAAQVHEVARRLVALINGIGRIQNPSFRPVRFADAYENDAGVTVAVAAGRLDPRLSHTAKMAVLDPDGNVVPQPPPGPGRLAKAAANRDAAEVLHILGKSPAPNFAELYKVDEIMQSSGRIRAVMQAAGVSGNERNRFTRTANHQDASGADSRHARSKELAPENPMSIDEARAMIGKLATAWLDSL